MLDLPKPRTWIISPPKTFADIEEMAKAEAAANGWAVKIERVAVDGQEAALVVFSGVVAPEGAAATIAGAGGMAMAEAAGMPVAAVVARAAVLTHPMAAAADDGSLAHLSTLADPVPISELDEVRLKELQRALGRLGYPVGAIDGLYGPKTRSAWAEFKTDVYPGNPSLIGPDSVLVLKEKLQDLASAGISTGASDVWSKEATIMAIRKACLAQGIGLPTQVAYVLATTQWETAQTFRPVKEAFWKDEAWRKKNFRYFPYYGRGYVQLTWKNNYETYSHLLNMDLVNNPDLALDPKVALFVLVHGFKAGTFTGRKITDYINENKTDFDGARRCINGTDRAREIADLAQKFLASA
jgi:predicted chitinase